MSSAYIAGVRLHVQQTSHVPFDVEVLGLAQHTREDGVYFILVIEGKVILQEVARVNSSASEDPCTI